MPIEIFDVKKDIRNVLITPEIRARFLQLEPGEIANRHTHDLAHEIFLVLQGQAEFDINGEIVVLTPGQMCVAFVDEMHHVRSVGDEPMIIYLSVTPHLEPTHTHWDENGQRKPPVYGASTALERADLQIDDERRMHQAAALKQEFAAFADAVHESATRFGDLCDDLVRSTESSNTDQSEATIDAMWEDIYRIHRTLRAVQATWNEVAANNGRREG